MVKIYDTAGRSLSASLRFASRSHTTCIGVRGASVPAAYVRSNLATARELNILTVGSRHKNNMISFRSSDTRETLGSRALRLIQANQTSSGHIFQHRKLTDRSYPNIIYYTNKSHNKFTNQRRSFGWIYFK